MDVSALQLGPLLGTIEETGRSLLSGDAFAGRNGTLLVVAATFIGYRLFGFLIGVTLRLIVAIVRLFVAAPMVGATGLLNDLTALIQRVGGQRRASLARPLAIALLAGGVYYIANGALPQRPNTAPPPTDAVTARVRGCAGELVDLTCPAQ